MQASPNSNRLSQVMENNIHNTNISSENWRDIDYIVDIERMKQYVK